MSKSTRKTVKISKQSDTKAFLPRTRIRVMDPIAKEAFTKNCYPFYNNNLDRGKTIDEIRSTLKCQTYHGKKGKESNLLYFRNDNDPSEYRVFAKKNLNENACFSNYNNYIDPQKGIHDHDELTMEGLLASCSENDLSQVNPNFVSLLDYVSQIVQDLKVKKIITLFIFNLVMYTNITHEALDELFKGAYVIVRDGGFLYKKSQCYGRTCNTRAILSESSHESMNGEQYRLGDGVLYSCDKSGACNKNKSNEVFDLLVGRSILPDFYGDTWFQFEYANLLTFVNKVPLHGYSFAVHKAMGGMNVGPLGNSEYSEYLKILFLDVCKTNASASSLGPGTGPGPVPVPVPVLVPVPCVKSPIDIFAHSQVVVRENSIDLTQYKMIKNFVKSTFSKRGTVTIQSIIETMNNYIDRATKDKKEFFSVSKALGLTNIALADLLQQISTKLSMLLVFGPARESDFEQIIEILFLSYYYTLHDKPFEEFVSLLDKRYRLFTRIRTRNTGRLGRSHSGGRKRSIKHKKL